jgi:hypothetical protein
MVSDVVRSRDVTIYKMRERRRSRWGWIRTQPLEVIVVDGCAVAVYDDDGSVQYRTLEELLEDHGLIAADLLRAT